MKEKKHIYIGSGHGLGKDFICGGIGPWFLDSFSPSKVALTAPTDRQVKRIMWAETLGHWNKRPVEFGGTPYTDPYIEIVKESWYLIGFTTKETGASKKAGGGKFSGFHSPNLCVIVSEAQAVEDEIYDQIDGVATSENCLVIFIGNPTRASGRFARGLKDPINNIVFNFSCLENPNYIHRKTIIPGLTSYEWVEDKRRKWGEDDPRWYGRVLGKIPPTSINNVFSQDMIDHMLRRIPVGHTHNAGVSLDVAGEGTDENVLYGGKNGVVSKSLCKTNQSPGQNSINVLDGLKEIRGNFAIIDCDGLGIGVWQEIMNRDEARRYHIIKFHGCSTMKALEPKSKEKQQYHNLRAKAHFMARQRAMDGLASIPDDPELIEDLLEVKYFENSRGMIQIEDKDDIKERLGRSPNKGDSWVMLQWGYQQNYQRIIVPVEQDGVDRQGRGTPIRDNTHDGVDMQEVLLA